MGKKRLRVHNWGAWEEHTPSEWDSSRYFYRYCLDCGESEHAPVRVVCDIR